MKTKLTLVALVLALLGWGNYSSAQAALFKDLEPGSTSSTPEQFTTVNGTMYFISIINYRHALWKTDGTVANTVIVKDSIITTNVGDRFMIRGHIGDTLYYTVNENVLIDTTTELWMTTGGTPVLMATLTTRMIAGISNGEPRQYAIAGGKLYFQMYTDHGYELWVCDGTTAGTHEVVDLCPGTTGPVFAEGAQNEPMVAYNGKIYFRGNTTPGGSELFYSDGTSGGTATVKPGTLGYEPQNLYVYQNELYFYSNAGANQGLWKTDGTAAGTVFITNIGFNNTVKTFKGNMYFAVAGSLWKSDGTAGGTVLVKDTIGGIDGMLNDYFFTSYMKSLPTPPYYEIHYWKSDGTTGGTVRVSDSLGKSASFAVLNNKMYSAATGTALWESDGTEAGTRNVIGGIINYPTVFNNSVFFTNWGTGSGYELWSFAPTSTGIAEEKVKNAGLKIYPNPSSGIFKVEWAGNENTRLQVFNLFGEEVLQQTNSNLVDLSNFPAGAYFVKVSDGAKVYCEKILIQQ